MEGPRSCKTEEVPMLLKLVNGVFRPEPEFKPTMQDEFKLLFSKENLNHVRIMTDGIKPVSNVDFYNSTIFIEGFPITAASVGSVCTDDKYRGKGCSSKILDDAEAMMKSEGTDVMLVSGCRGLYLRRGCTMAGNVSMYSICRDDFKNKKLNDIEIQNMDEHNVESVYKIYNSESTRYYRTKKEFHDLFKAFVIGYGNNSFKSFIVKSSGNCTAYAIIEITKTDNEVIGELKEFSGNREDILSLIKEILYKENIDYIRVYCNHNESIRLIFEREGFTCTKAYIMGTIKIINFEKLMSDLMPYFKQYVDEKTVEKLKFKEDNEKYIISAGDESVQIDDMHTLVSVVFGNKESVSLDFENKLELKKFFKNVFPLPFVWPGNLNYQ